MKYKKIEKDFISLLKEIKKRKAPDFSGTGLVLYKSKDFSDKNHSCLRPSVKCPESISLSNKNGAVNFICKICRNSHSLHDGYHFLNEKGRLTHVAQYFWPPIINEVKPNEKYGTRHLSAKYGVYIRGVIAIGIINHNYNIFYFTKGKTREL